MVQPIQRAGVPSPTTRCRYKTGRCPNARALKSNGTLLLLCEYHRSQQNRTKKRSDMKCRHTRAKKRQAQREKLHSDKYLATSPFNDEPYAPPITVPIPRITSSQVDVYMTSNVTAMGRSRAVDKYNETGSPTATDVDISTVNWTPNCLSPITTPKICPGALLASSLHPEDVWLLEYFIM